MSKKNLLILIALIALIVIMILIRNASPVVDKNQLPAGENDTVLFGDEENPTEITAIESELDLIDVDSQIDEEIKLIDADLENL